MFVAMSTPDASTAGSVAGSSNSAASLARATAGGSVGGRDVADLGSLSTSTAIVPSAARRNSKRGASGTAGGSSGGPYARTTTRAQDVQLDAFNMDEKEMKRLKKDFNTWCSQDSLRIS